MTSIVILNYNGKPYLEMCLLTISAFTDVPYELIIIDNGSTDGSQEYLQAVDARDLTVIENPENIGCPPARAQGMALAKGDYVVLLDNDTLVTPGWLSRLIGHCDRDPRIGLLGPSTNYISGAQMIPALEYSGTQGLVDVAAIMAAHFAGNLQPTERLVGFCMFICRAVVDRIGACDASFGKYGFEDDDFTWRAIIAGFDAYIARDVFIHHTGGRGQESGSLDYTRLTHEAWSVFQSKWSLPGDLTVYGYGKSRGQHLPDRPFDVETDYIPLLDRAKVEPLITRHA
jgi:GT2 family glycosyltransferase